MKVRKAKFFAAALCGILFTASFTACRKNANNANMGIYDSTNIVNSEKESVSGSANSELTEKSAEILSENAKIPGNLPEFSEIKVGILSFYT